MVASGAAAVVRVVVVEAVAASLAVVVAAAVAVTAVVAVVAVASRAGKSSSPKGPGSGKATSLSPRFRPQHSLRLRGMCSASPPSAVSLYLALMSCAVAHIV